DRRGFYLTQAVLFAVATAVLLLVNARSIARPSPTALLLAAAYGLLTVLSQWMYTLSLIRCPVSVCAMVYSFGFILPTVFGTIVWREPVNAFKIVSILFCIGTIFLASEKRDASAAKPHGLPLPLIIAMLASGGLGIVQKLQQKSAASSETGMFLLLAFALATLLSLLAALTARSDATPRHRLSRALLPPILIVGVSMAAANTANTLLAGLLPSAVIFPTVNVGVNLASLAASALLLRETPTRRQLAAFALGITAILLFNL
ncbi:MAG: hypothetical protein ACI4XW_02305, partial [Candidatus Spyradocola sp.]